MAAIPVRELVTIWGFDIDDKPLKQMEVGVKNVKQSLAVVGAVAAASAGTLFGLAKSVANTGEEVTKNAAQVGISTDAYQELTFAAEQAGIAQSDLTAVLTDLSNKSFDVIEGNQQQALAFRRLGVQVANSAGDLRDADDVLLDLADSFSRLPDGAEKTVLATEALGGSGAKLIPFLNKGRAGIQEMREEAKKLGIVLGKDTLDASVKFNQSLRKALGALTGIKNTVGAELLPVIQELLDQFTVWIANNRKLLAQNVRGFVEFLKTALENMMIILKGAMSVLTLVTNLFDGMENAVKMLTLAVSVFLGLKLLAGIGALAIGMKNLISAWRAGTLAANAFNVSALLVPVIIGAIIAAIALLVEDFIAFSQGRDSVIGRTIEVFKKDFPEAFEVFKKIFELMGAVVDNLGERFTQVIDFVIDKFWVLINFVREKVFPFFKNSFIGKFFDKIGDFFTSDGFKKAIDSAKVAVQADTALLQGNAPPTSLPGLASSSRSVSQENNFNINADSLTKEEAIAAVQSGVAKSLSTTLRETERDVTPAVER